MNRYLIIFLTLCAAPLLFAEKPAYFQILADDYPLPSETVRPGTAPGGHWQPSGQERNAGYGCGLVDVELAPRMDWVWPEVSPRKTFLLIGMRNEVRAQSFVIRTLEDVKGLTVSATELVSENGEVIASDNVDVRRVKYRIYQKDSGEVQEGNFLKAPVPADFPAALSLWHWLSVFVPENAKPGVYRGSLRISSEKSPSLSMEIALRVLERSFPGYPAGFWGAWMPGHFHGQSRGSLRNYAPEWWLPERMETFFRFFISRGFNCPVYSGVYNSYWMNDKEIKADFSVINQFVAAQKKAGADAGLLLDSIATEEWAHATNRWIEEHHGGQRPDGFLGITEKDGKHCTATGVPYNDKDSEYYAEAIMKLKRNAEDNHWPFYFVYPEEEIDNRPEKTAGYEHFMPVLRKIVGDEHCMVVDNSMGYPWSNLDRGWRDKLPNRSYNLWVKLALDHVREDNAKVWTFNRGWERTAWGVYMQRIGAVGANQWAEAWDGGSYGEWYNAIPTADGNVLTSLNYERAALGLRDLSVYRQLEAGIQQLRQAGMVQEADAFEARLKALTAFYPLNMFCWGLRNFQSKVKDASLEARRYEALVALDQIENLLTGKDVPKPKAAAGQPALVSAEVPPARLGEGEQHDCQLFTDGRPSSFFCWTDKSGIYQRSVAISEQQFRTLYQPPKVTLSADASTAGLDFSFEENGTKNSTRSPELPIESDNSYRIVLQPQHSHDVFSFIFTLDGQVALWKNGRKCETRLQAVFKTENGKSFLKVRMPWKIFGCKKEPRLERWHLNAGRVYRTPAVTSSWTFVSDELECNRGYLVFDKSASKDDVINIGKSYLGRNRLTGTLNAADIPIILTSPDGQTRNALSKSDGSFELEYRVEESNAGTWWLQYGNRRISFATEKPTAFLEAKLLNETVISGDRICLETDYRLGNAEENFELSGRMVRSDGLEMPIASMRVPGLDYSMLYVDTTGLPEGGWTVFLTLHGIEHRTIGSLSVLPPAW